MKRRHLFIIVFVLLGIPALVLGAAISENDSTQPRGSAAGVFNPQGQPLSPVVHGFRAPAYRAGFADGGEFYFDWSGGMMGNTMRDPAFLATLSVANKDLINLINAFNDTELNDFLIANKLDQDVARDPLTGKVKPMGLLPVAADLCLRCHAPVGWLEAHSEPPTSSFPFLKGQFWGTKFRENPVNASGNPRLVNTAVESEAEMDGVQCDFCHRAQDNFKRQSLFNGNTIPNGNGGFFVNLNDPFPTGAVEVTAEFQDESHFCGTCHDVTNPLIKTATVVNAAVPDMYHPLERTFTEWYWSAYRNAGISCQNCHAPMQFLGAQTWLLSPGLDNLWGTLDAKWGGVPYNYDVPATRTAAYLGARTRNDAFMKTAAIVSFVNTPASVTPGQNITVNVRVENRTGHKLPTGFGEGRQMWLHIRAVDDAGTVIFEDGIVNTFGRLVRNPGVTKVYEHVALADGYETRVGADGFNILDADKDGVVTETEKEFHFVLINNIVKDNRIPPRGYNKAAYTADGAFIVPHDPKDTDYPTSQYWDITPYTFTVPAGVTGQIRVSAELLYQTFSKEYITFLRNSDTTRTQAHGGVARNIPTTGIYGADPTLTTWGKAMSKIWQDANKGPAVLIDSAIGFMDIQ